MEPDGRAAAARRMRGNRQWPRASLLASLEEASRDRLLAQGAMRVYPSDRVLIRMGEQSSFVVVLMQGAVKATSLTPDGKEVLLMICVGGDLVGEFAAMYGKPRSSTVTTCGPVVGRVIAQPDFVGMLARDEALARAVNRAVLGKLRFANERRVDFAGYDAHTRVARILRELAVAYGERDGDRVVLNWPLTQIELASLASVAEPTVQKALRRLRAAGVITTGYRSLTVESLGELDALARP
jgi:CRP/FNR family transcriptional regulator, cyclic AMP receptor protein